MLWYLRNIGTSINYWSRITQTRGEENCIYGAMCKVVSIPYFRAGLWMEPVWRRERKKDGAKKEMVARRFVVRHNDDEFPVDYDTGDGLEVCAREKILPFSYSLSFLPLVFLPFFEEPKETSQKSPDGRRFSNSRSSHWPPSLLTIKRSFLFSSLMTLKSLLFVLLVWWAQLEFFFLKILTEEEGLLVNESSDLEAISDKLRLVSIQVEEQNPESVWNQEQSDQELARFLQVAFFLKKNSEVIKAFIYHRFCLLGRRGGAARPAVYR